MKIEMKKILTLSINQRHLKFLDYTIRKVGLENLMLIGYTEGKGNRGKHRITSLKYLFKLIPEND